MEKNVGGLKTKPRIEYRKEEILRYKPDRPVSGTFLKLPGIQFCILVSIIMSCVSYVQIKRIYNLLAKKYTLILLQPYFII